MALDSVISPPIFPLKDDKCVESDDLEEGEIEDDEIPDEGVYAGKFLQPAATEWPAATANHHKSLRSPIHFIDTAKFRQTTAYIPCSSQPTWSCPRSVRNINRWYFKNTLQNGKSDIIEKGIHTPMKVRGSIHNSCFENNMNECSGLMKSKRKKHRSKPTDKSNIKKLSKKQQKHAKANEKPMEIGHVQRIRDIHDDELLVMTACPSIYNKYGPPSSHNEHRYNLHLKKHSSCKVRHLSRGTISQKRQKYDEREISSKSRRIKRRFCQNNFSHSNLKMKLFKSYHTQLRRSTGDQSKFRQVQLRDATKFLLNKRLEVVPNEILGDVPSLIDKKADTMMCTKKYNSTKKIPSLLEIEVPIPANFVASNCKITFRGKENTVPTCDITDSGETRSCTTMPLLHRLENFATIHQWDTEHFMGFRDPSCDQMPETVGSKEKGLSNLTRQLEVCDRQCDTSREVNDCISALPSLSSHLCTKEEQTGTENHKANILPHNLPKKQRELFLRIQQKQREASDFSSQYVSNKDKTSNEDDSKEIVQQEKWYSDDEEDASLVDFLKNLSSQQPFPSKDCMSPPCISSSSSATLNKLSISGISESVDKVLSSIRIQTSNNAVNMTAKTVPSPQLTAEQARDPQLTSWNPRHRSTTTTNSPMHIIACNTQTLIQEHSAADNTVTYGSSSGNLSYSAAATTSHDDGGLESLDFGSHDVDSRNLLSVQDLGLQHDTERDIYLWQNIRPLTHFSVIHDDVGHRGAAPIQDKDLRRMMGLPFNFTHLHKPATEIDASLTSHAPIPYKIVPITVPHPDYSILKVNTADPQIQKDPRIHKLCSIS
jgi:hypothetical protein